MYVGIQSFQNKVTKINEQLDKTQTKNMEFIEIIADLYEMKLVKRLSEFPKILTSDDLQ
jgi:hypothetical protein